MTKYVAGDGFKQMATLGPLVEEAGSENSELWLIQLPTYELGPKDLMDKQWTMHPGAADSTLGYFYNSRVQSIEGEQMKVFQQCFYLDPQLPVACIWNTPHPRKTKFRLFQETFCNGELYDVVKQDAPMRKLFAILPELSEYSVRAIETTVCFKKHHDLSAVELTKPALKVSSERKLKGDSNKSNSKRSLKDEKQSSIMTEASVGNKEGEAEVEGQKKKKKKKKKRSRTEESTQS